METFKSNDHEKGELTERQEIEAAIMNILRSFFDTIDYDLTWGDLLLIKNLAHHVIVDIEQHQKEIQEAEKEGNSVRAQNIAHMMPGSYHGETLARFLNQRFDGLTVNELNKNYPGKEGGKFLKRIRDGQNRL